MSSGQRLDNLNNSTNDAQDSVEEGNQNHLPGWCGEGLAVKPNFQECGICAVCDGDLRDFRLCEWRRGMKSEA